MGQKRSRPRLAYDVTRFATGDFLVEELYNSDEIIDWCAAAHSRIVGVFLHATENHHRKPTHKEYEDDKVIGLNRPRQAVVSTDNYIVGVDDKRASLARFVQKTVVKHFVRPRNLPDWLRTREGFAIKTAAEIEYKLFRLELDNLCDNGDIWYDECLGIWCIAQSVVDEHTKARHSRKRRLKVDGRNYHGRPREQSKSRGIPGGTSVGGAVTN